MLNTTNKLKEQKYTRVSRLCSVCETFVKIITNSILSELTKKATRRGGVLHFKNTYFDNLSDFRTSVIFNSCKSSVIFSLTFTSIYLTL